MGYIYIYIYMCYTMEMKKMCVGESGVPHNEIKIFFYNHGNKKKFFSFAYFFLKNFRRGSIAEHNIIHSFFFVYRKKQYKNLPPKKKVRFPSYTQHPPHCLHAHAHSAFFLYFTFTRYPMLHLFRE